MHQLKHISSFQDPTTLSPKQRRFGPHKIQGVMGTELGWWSDFSKGQNGCILRMSLRFADLLESITFVFAGWFFIHILCYEADMFTYHCKTACCTIGQSSCPCIEMHDRSDFQIQILILFCLSPRNYRLLEALKVIRPRQKPTRTTIA